MVSADSQTRAARFQELQNEIEAILTSAANMYNISFSVGMVDFVSGLSLATARGVDNRETGAHVTTNSEFPVGSVNKALVAVSALRLHERNLLDLDAPFLPIVEPWLKQRGLPSLAAMWEGTKNSSKALAQLRSITSRQLLSMQSGMPDYDDGEMQTWQWLHPKKDFTPFDYLQNCSRMKPSFDFTPGAPITRMIADLMPLFNGHCCLVQETGPRIPPTVLWRWDWYLLR